MNEIMRLFQSRYFGLGDASGGGGDGGQGGGQQGAGDQGNQGGGQGGNQAGQQGSGDTWQPPQGLPADFVGKDANETISKLFAGYTELDGRAAGLREKISKLPAAPKTPDEYTFAPEGDLKNYFGDVANDPLLKSSRIAAHKLGMSNEQFSGFITEAISPLVKEGILPAPYDPAKEIETFSTANGYDKKRAAEVLAANETFANGLGEQLTSAVPEAMRPQVKAAIVALTDTAAGMQLLSALSARFNDIGIKVGGEQSGNGAITDADLKKLDGDPRIDPANRNHTDPNRRFDPDLRKRYDEAYMRLRNAG